MFNSIRTKLLIVVCISYILGTAAIVGFGIVSTKQIITSENEKAYISQLEVILRTLQKRHEKLTASGMAGLFADGYKKTTAKDLGALHYGDNQKIYPFIVDATGLIVLHPVLAPGSAEIATMGFTHKMLSAKNGTLRYRWRDNEKWMVFRTFEPWHWTIGYAIKTEDKYASIQKVVRNLTAIMGLSALLVLVVIYAMLSRIVEPISVLAEDARVIGEGQYEHQVAEVKGGDEIARLTASLRLMAQNINDRDKEIRGFNEQLEQRVQQRTAALEKSEERFRDVALSSADWIWELDCDGHYTYSAGRVKEILGFDHDEIIGKTAYDLMPHEEAVRISGLFQEAGRKKQAIVDHANWNLAKDGRRVCLLSNGVPVFSKKGELLGYRGVDKDITERKHAEDELKRAKEAAEAATQAKSEFLANMSHEIRTPMNGIIGMTELVLGTNLPAEQRKYLEMAKTSADSLLALINDILDFSKIEAGKMELETIDFNLRVALENAADSLALKAHEKGLELVCHIRPDVPTALIGDPGRLRQVIVNIAGNSIKFTEEGEIVIRVEVESELADSVNLHFMVSDTGIGIPPARLESIFNSFEQVDGSTTRKFGGTGLGLSICRQLVEMMGGKIHVESPNRFRLEEDSITRGRESRIGGPGSIFHFTVRFELSRSKDIRVQRPKPQDLSGMPVLIVDDNYTNRILLKEMVTAWGLVPTISADGKQALDHFNTASGSGTLYQLILLDLQMPGLDGFDVAKIIKDAPSGKDARIILLSSMGERGDSDRCKEVGISAYLSKPIKQSDLFDAIMMTMGLCSEEASRVITRHTVYEERERFDILLAEDNLVNQTLAIKLLETRGHRVVLASNGLEAVEAFKEGDFDLILMDIQMPEMDGFEATKEIRKLENESRKEESRAERVPIIAMTAHAMAGDREKCIDAGMDDYVSKPIKPEALFSVINNVARKSENEKEQNQPPILQSAKTFSPTTFDMSKAMETVSGDKDLFREIADLFIENCPDYISGIRQGVAENDAGVLEKQAHSLKGAVGNFNAMEVYEAAFHLEKLGKEGKMAKSVAGLSHLEKALNELVAEMKTVLQKMEGV